MKVIEILINKKHGGFGFSDEAIKLYATTGKSVSYCEDLRCDVDMIKIVKSLGDKANGHFSKLQVESIPEDYRDCYEIKEYDGFEYIELLEDKYKLKQILRIIDDNQDMSAIKTIAESAFINKK